MRKTIKEFLCRFCYSKVEHYSTSSILGFKAEYYRCQNCFSVQVRNPTWLEEAHTNAISKFDTGLVTRCFSAANIIGSILALEGLRFSRGVDWAGGTGLLTRILRDQGFNAFTIDKYAQPLHAHGFELTKVEASIPATFISAIECIEHLESPLEELIEFTSNKEYFFLTVDLISRETPDPVNNEWWYYLPESGQHITFPTAAGLLIFGKKLGFDHYFRVGAMHVLSRRKLKIKTRFLMSIRILRVLILLLLPRFLMKKHSLTSKDQENLIKEFRREN